MEKDFRITLDKGFESAWLKTLLVNKRSKFDSLAHDDSRTMNVFLAAHTRTFGILDAFLGVCRSPTCGFEGEILSVRHAVYVDQCNIPNDAGYLNAARKCPMRPR